MPDPASRSDANPEVSLTIEAGASFEGVVLLHGAARIDGSVRGEVVGAEWLEIGETAVLEAAVEAARLGWANGSFPAEELEARVLEEKLVTLRAAVFEPDG